MPVQPMYETGAIAMTSKKIEFSQVRIERNAPGDDDVELDIKFCGICHFDASVAHNEFSSFVEPKFPLVPGHEIAGIVTRVGRGVKDVEVGEKVGIGE